MLAQIADLSLIMEKAFTGLGRLISLILGFRSCFFRNFDPKKTNETHVKMDDSSTCLGGIESLEGAFSVTQRDEVRFQDSTY